MQLKAAAATALLLFTGAAFATTGVPEIDGMLSIQAITLLGGVIYLLKRRK